MAKSQKALNDEIKAFYFEKVWDFLSELGEDVIKVKSNEIAFPVVDSEGGEKSVVIVIKVPTGANKGTEPYDPYSMGEEYRLKEKAMAEKVAKAKAEKIAKDKIRREKEKELKAKREGNNGE